MEASASIAAVTVKRSSPLPLCNIAGFLLAFKGAITFLFFRSSPQAGAGATVALTLSWALLVVGYSILDPPKPKAAVEIPQWVLIYLGLAGTSLLWTTTNSTSVATAYWAAMAADVFSIWLLLRYEPLHANIVRIMYGFIAGGVVVAVIAWAAPAMDDMRLGNEDFLHPNLIGFEFAIAALFCAYLAQRNRNWSWLCAGFVITTVRTLSKGTIVAFLFASLYYILRGLQIRRRTRVYLGIAGGVVLLGFWGLLETYFDLYTQGRNLETLTGRTYIWTTALEIAQEKLWFGHGFDSFRWVFPPFESFQPWHAHNEWIQQLFTYGVVGLIVVIGVYVSSYRAIRSSSNAGLKSLATAILVLVLVRSVVDTDRFELCFPLWLLTMLSIGLAGETAPYHSA